MTPTATLAHELRLGEGGGRYEVGPMVAVHGFTQNRGCWGDFGRVLARRNDLLVLDAPGHGDSSEVVASFEDGAALIGATGGRATYVGYSMGGRYALRLALDQPELVEALVLIGASPGIEDPAERSSRRMADHALADRIETIGVDAFLEEWLANPLFATLPEGARFVGERRKNTAKGLASSLRTAGTGEMEPLWDRLADLAVPTLLLVGALDLKFRATAERMVSVAKRGRVVAVPNAGHTVHLEQPHIATLVNTWVAANTGRRRLR